MITSAAYTIAQNAVKVNTLDTINYFVVKNSSGEFFRKVPTAIDTLATYKKKFTLYLTENEANTIIASVSLISNGTALVGSGTEICNQVWIWDKTTGPQSGYFYYTLEVV